LRILVITHYFYPENFRINDVVGALVGRGHDVTVLTGIPNYPQGKLFGEYKLFRSEKIFGARVIRVPLIPRGSGSAFRLLLNYFSFLFSAVFVGPMLLLGKNFDVVLSTAYSPPTGGLVGVIFAKIKSARSLLMVQDLWPASLEFTGFVKNKLLLGMVGKVIAWMYNQTDYLLVQSQSFVSVINSQGIETEKMVYFPDWAEDIYKPAIDSSDCCLRHLFPRANFTIVFAGNLGTAQSLETIIDAADLLRSSNIHWLILGDGSRKNWLESEVKSRKLESSITLLGQVPMEHTPSYFYLGDVMLVTLSNDITLNTTLPGKVQSYMACGRPILSALGGEGKKVIESSGCGINVDPGNAKDLAMAALKLSTLPREELEEMGDRSREYCLDVFNKDILLDKFEQLINFENRRQR